MNSKQLILVASLAVFAACTQSQKPTEAKTDSVATDSSAVTIANIETEAVFADYIELKNALVKSDANTAKSAAAKLSTSLKAIEGCEPTSLVADSIAKETDIVLQRKRFVLLSAELIPVMKHAPIKSGKVFVQYCPMANDSKGASWLSSESKIRNPYYGDEMLDCGEVTDEIAAK